jgi:hypothetical protein
VDYGVTKKQFDVPLAVSIACVKPLLELLYFSLLFYSLPSLPFLSECSPHPGNLVKRDVLLPKAFVLAPIQICVGTVMSFGPLSNEPAFESRVTFFKGLEHRIHSCMYRS